MIQANELRIGNWVLNDGSPEITTSIYVYNPTNGEEYILVRMGAKEGVNIRDLKPIELTEDLLLKNGFKIVSRRDTFNVRFDIAFECRYRPKGINDDCFLVIAKDNGVFNHIVPSDNSKRCTFIPIYYLHQLQNLYIALSGKEMEVNL